MQQCHDNFQGAWSRPAPYGASRPQCQPCENSLRPGLPDSTAGGRGHQAPDSCIETSQSSNSVTLECCLPRRSKLWIVACQLQTRELWNPEPDSQKLDLGIGVQACNSVSLGAGLEKSPFLRRFSGRVGCVNRQCDRWRHLAPLQAG